MLTTQAGDLDLAIQLYKRSIEMHPTADAHTFLGWSYHFQGKIDQVTATLENMDRIGGPDAYNHYPWGWAWAGNTPFRRWKRETYRGGCAVPLVVSWPAGLPQAQGLRHGYAHVIDIVPTVLDLLNAQAPATLDGRAQTPLEGSSFASQLLDASQPSAHRVQYDEMMGHRALYEDGWRAVCPWPAPSAKESANANSPCPTPPFNSTFFNKITFCINSKENN
mgnify:CR=1 FL=1